MKDYKNNAQAVCDYGDNALCDVNDKIPQDECIKARRCDIEIRTIAQHDNVQQQQEISKEYLRAITDNAHFVEMLKKALKGNTTIDIEPNIIETIVRRDKIPAVERLYLEDENMFGNIVSPIIRPSVELTRDDLNTAKGRKQIFDWLTRPTRQSILARKVNLFYLYMNNDCDEWRKYMYPMAALVKGNRNGVDVCLERDGNTLYFDNIEAQPYMVMMFTELPINAISCGLFRYEKTIAVHQNPTFWTFHPDIVMELVKGAPIEGRMDFEQICRAYYTTDKIDVLMHRYDAMQKYLDGLFATYLLFKTENFASVEHLPAWQQHVALQNYFSTFKYYTQTDRLPDEQLPIIDKKSKTRYTRKDGYQYEGVAYTGRLKYIVSEIMEDVLHAPANLRPYANGQKNIVADSKPAKKQKFVQLPDGKRAYSREPNEQIIAYALRNRTPDLFSAIVGKDERKARIIKDTKENGFSEEQIFDVCRPSPKRQKFHDYMMKKIQESPDFNHVEYGRVVSAALNAENRDEALLNISNKFACTIDLKDCAEWLYNRDGGLHAEELSSVANLLFTPGEEQDEPIFLTDKKGRLTLFTGRRFSPMSMSATFTIEGKTNPDQYGGFDLALVNKEYKFDTVRLDSLKVRVVYSPLLFYGMDKGHIPHPDEWYRHVRKLGMSDNWSRTTLRVLELYKIQAYKTRKHEQLIGGRINKQHNKHQSNDTELAVVEQTTECSVVTMYEFVSTVIAMSPQNIPNIDTVGSRQKHRWIQYIERELMALANDGIHITKFERNDLKKQYLFYWKKPLQIEPTTDTSAGQHQ